jgi:hypothetical protein
MFHKVLHKGHNVAFGRLPHLASTGFHNELSLSYNDTKSSFYPDSHRDYFLASRFQKASKKVNNFSLSGIYLRLVHLDDYPGRENSYRESVPEQTMAAGIMIIKRLSFVV